MNPIVVRVDIEKQAFTVPKLGPDAEKRVDVALSDISTVGEVSMYSNTRLGLVRPFCARRQIRERDSGEAWVETHQLLRVRAVLANIGPIGLQGIVMNCSLISFVR